MQQNVPQQKRSSTFGIIALVVAVLAFMTPKFLISLVLMALAAFVVIGFIRDGSKIYSAIALMLGLLLFYFLGQEAANSDRMYTVRYEVECLDCDVSYTNATGGTDKKSNMELRWHETITAKGDEFVYLNAQANDKYARTVHGKIYVDGILVKEESSSGDYAITSFGCRPEEVNSK